MGFEYLIKVKLTPAEKQDIINLFKNKKTFSHIVSSNRQDLFEFKSTSSTSQMPDFLTAFDENGIYVCQNLKTDIWNGMKDIKEYLRSQKKIVTIEEL